MLPFVYFKPFFLFVSRYLFQLLCQMYCVITLSFTLGCLLVSLLLPGQEPWFSGYEWRLMFQRLWVWILAPYTGWIFGHFFTCICCKNCIVCLKRPKIKRKEAGVGPFLLKKSLLLPIWAFARGRIRTRIGMSPLPTYLAMFLDKMIVFI